MALESARFVPYPYFRVSLTAAMFRLALISAALVVGVREEGEVNLRNAKAYESDTSSVRLKTHQGSNVDGKDQFGLTLLIKYLFVT